MHKIKYTQEEYLDLLEVLRVLANDTSINIDNVFVICADIEWYNDNHEELYDRLKRDMDQFPFEVLYHHPLKSLMTLVAHPNPLVKAIVAWRIRISK